MLACCSFLLGRSWGRSGGNQLLNGLLHMAWGQMRLSHGHLNRLVAGYSQAEIDDYLAARDSSGYPVCRSKTTGRESAPLDWLAATPR